MMCPPNLESTAANQPVSPAMVAREAIGNALHRFEDRLYNVDLTAPKANGEFLKMLLELFKELLPLLIPLFTDTTTTTTAD